MAASLWKKFPRNLWPVFCRSSQIFPRLISDSTVNDEGKQNTQIPTTISHSEEALSKFGRLVETFESKEKESFKINENKPEDLSQSFATMLRKSRLIALGEDQDSRVFGKIIEVMEDDLYIDFGGKFHCVCPRPKKDGELYQRGAEVILNLKSQEMSSAFLGSDVHITLLEADGVLMGLRHKPKINRL